MTSTCWSRRCATCARLDGPRFLHVVTRKGKGYLPAEIDPVAYHGVGTFDPSKDHLPKAKTRLAHLHRGLRPMAVRHGGAGPPAARHHAGHARGLRPGGILEQRFPERYFDVGIAEQHAVTLAAGQACEGFKPVVAIYSTFLQRAYDQLIHDVALQNLPVVFAIDRAGLVGPMAPPMPAAYDFSFLRCIPNIVIMAPSDENECRQMLYTGFQHDGPAAVRYPRGKGPGIPSRRK